MTPSSTSVLTSTTSKSGGRRQTRRPVWQLFRNRHEKKVDTDGSHDGNQETQCTISIIPQDVFFHHVFPMLGPEDVAAFRSVCKYLRQTVNLYYTSPRVMPLVTREAKLPTTMRYVPWKPDMFNQSYDGTTVVQVQTFAFQVRTKTCGMVVLKLQFLNEVWSEVQNEKRLTTRTFPSKTKCEGCITCPRHGTDKIPCRWHEECLFLCAERLQHMQGSFPSVEYILSSFQHPSRIPRGLKDRQTIVEWDYRPAKSSYEWKEKCLHPFCRDYYLDELPWYQTDDKEENEVSGRRSRWLCR